MKEFFTKKRFDLIDVLAFLFGNAVWWYVYLNFIMVPKS